MFNHKVLKSPLPPATLLAKVFHQHVGLLFQQCRDFSF